MAQQLLSSPIPNKVYYTINIYAKNKFSIEK